MSASRLPVSMYLVTHRGSKSQAFAEPPSTLPSSAKASLNDADRRTAELSPQEEEDANSTHIRSIALVVKAMGKLDYVV